MFEPPNSFAITFVIKANIFTTGEVIVNKIFIGFATASAILSDFSNANRFGTNSPKTIVKIPIIAVIRSVAITAEEAVTTGIFNFLKNTAR